MWYAGVAAQISICKPRHTLDYLFTCASSYASVKFPRECRVPRNSSPRIATHKFHNISPLHLPHYPTTLLSFHARYAVCDTRAEHIRPCGCRSTARVLIKSARVCVCSLSSHVGGGGDAALQNTHTRTYLRYTAPRAIIIQRRRLSIYICM